MSDTLRGLLEPSPDSEPCRCWGCQARAAREDSGLMITMDMQIAWTRFHANRHRWMVRHA